MFLGPIMMLQPSKRDAKVAKLRFLATKFRLSVQLRSVPHGVKMEEVSVYSMPWTDDFVSQNRSAFNWELRKGDMVHELHFLNDWDWVLESNQQAAPKKYHSVIQAIIGNIPTPGSPNSQVTTKLTGEITSIGARESGFQVFWNEKTGPNTPEKTIELLSTWMQEQVNLIEATNSSS